MHHGGFEPIKEMEILHIGNHKDVVLVTLIYKEVSQSGICNKLPKLLESSFVHEGIVWPFARTDIHPTRNVEVTVQGVPNDSFGIPFQGSSTKNLIFLRTNF